MVTYRPKGPGVLFFFIISFTDVYNTCHGNKQFTYLLTYLHMEFKAIAKEISFREAKHVQWVIRKTLRNPLQYAVLLSNFLKAIKDNTTIVSYVFSLLYSASIYWHKRNKMFCKMSYTWV